LFRVPRGGPSPCPDCPAAETFFDGGVHTIERVYHNNGRRPELEITSSPLLGRDGAIAACVTVVRDITRRKRAENTVRLIAEGTTRETGERFFASLVAHLSKSLGFRYVLVGEADAEGKYVSTRAVWFGGRLAENFEYSLRGTPCQNVLSSHEFCIYPESVQTLFPQDTDLVEMQAESYVGIPLFSRAGQLLGLLALLDVTPRHLGETEKAVLRIFADRAGAEMERTLSEREKRALEAQFLQAQKMESVGRLAGGIAHDFNNILSAILGYSELALTKLPGDSRIRNYLQIILDSGDKAANLTRQLLAFSRKQVLEMKVVNLNNLIDNMGKMLARLIGEDIELELRTEQTTRNVLADPSQIEQVVMNLAVNARDAMPSGGRLVLESSDVELDDDYARAHKGSKPGSYVALSVTDSGTGMDEDTLGKVFEPFYTTKSEGKGTGLGLATVYGIVKQHNGYIWVYSEVGRGTVFKIYLPVSSAEPEDGQANPLPALQGRGETILVVDDDNIIRNLVVDAIAPLGYKIIEAASGEDALRMSDLFHGTVDLVLTDVVMSGINGPTLVDALRKRRPEIKVVFMSGYPDAAMPDVKTSGHARTLYIQKPLTPCRIAAVLRQALGPG